MIGQALGHYRIESKLGEGGMGVVYKALDTHLNRTVAIKVLPAGSVADSTRRQRFIQEARAASALDHPNIITVHDIAEIEGQHFIVMQYVVGKTLRELLYRGGLPLKEVLRYAIQIADALAQAHARGIVHRDLKPENIMVTEQGQIKILDFGLAKLTERGDSDEFAATETMKSGQPAHTEEGAILGTVAYMSPEQAEGKKVDVRSDIFSFGSVLYEMVTGQRAFSGQTKISTLSAILHKDPKAPSETASGVPRDLERIIARCLRKEPERRIQHMDDVKTLLEEIKEESESGKLATQPLPAARPPRHLRVSAVLAGIVLLVGAGAAVTWWLMRSGTPKTQGPALTRLTSDYGLTTEPALSPDGKLVAYASDRAGMGKLDIWLQQLAGGEPVRLTHGEGDNREPAFSPDGSEVAFRSNRDEGGIYVIATVGGTERKIAERGKRPRFSPDGSLIAYWIGETGGGQAPAKLFVVSAASGATTEIRSKLPVARNPVWSPDGKWLLFECADSVTAAVGYDWCVVSLNDKTITKTGAVDTLRRQKLIPAEIGQLSALPVPGAWLEQRIVFSATLGDSTNLWQVPITPQTFRISGPAQRLTSATAMESEPSIASPGPHGQSPLMVFSSLSENVDIWSVPMDTTVARVSGEPQRLTQDLASDIRPSISLDGKKLLFNSNRSRTWDVWIKDLGSGKETLLVASPAEKLNPKISGDGSKVVYSILQNNKQATYLVSAAGGLPKKVCDDCYSWRPSLDGRRMTFFSGRMIGILDTETLRKTDILRLHSGNNANYLMSWDGRWLLFYRVLDATHTVIFIAPIREGAVVDESEFISVTDGSTFDIVPDWSPDGNILYFLSDRDTARCLWALHLDPATKRPVGPAFPVQHFHRASLSPVYVKPGQRGISVARDKIVVTVAEHLGNIWMTELQGQN